MTTPLQQAIDLAKSGQFKQAEQLLRQVLSQQPDNEIAWMWLSGVTRDTEAKQQALQRALAINPANALAKRGIVRFGGSVPDSSLAEGATAEETFIGDQPAAPSESPEPTEESAEAAADPFNFDFEMDRPDLPDVPGMDTPSTETEETEAGAFDWAGDEDLSFDFGSTSTDEPAEPAAEDLPVHMQETLSGEDDSLGELDLSFPDLDQEPAADQPEPSSLFQTGDPTFPSLSGVDTASNFDFDWENPPDLQFDYEAEARKLAEAASEAEAAQGESESALTGVDALRAAALSNEVEAEVEVEQAAPQAEVVEAHIELDEPDLEPEAADDQPPDAQALVRNKERQERQQRIMGYSLIAFISLILIGAIVMIYVENVGIYSIMPGLTPSELTESASRSTGEAEMNFSGFPGVNARIQWVRDDEQATCNASGNGLAVDFQDGQEVRPISNQVCTGNSCVFDKELTGVPIRDVTVNYQCGRDATITLFQSP